MVLYIALGAMLFSLVEDEWDYLIGFYFCFTTPKTPLLSSRLAITPPTADHRPPLVTLFDNGVFTSV